MKTLLIILAAVLLSGCTTYKVTRVNPDGSSIDVSVRSSRSFEAPELRYTRTGQDATFDFGAASVQDGTAAMVGMFGQVFDAIVNGQLVPVPDAE